MKIDKISLANATNLLYHFKKMSENDQKRFAQCFNCKHLYTCTRTEQDKDKNELCKFYEEYMQDKPENFADVLGREMNKIIKENKNA